MSVTPPIVEFGKLIVVGGAPRSGTTLLQRMLLTHPDVGGGPEFDLLAELALHYQSAAERVSTGRLNYFFNEKSLATTFRGMCGTLLAAAGFDGQRWFCEKTPKNVIAFDSLIQLLPEAKYVFVFRDPRAITASMLEVGRKGESRPEWNDLDVAIDYVNRHWKGYLKLPDRDKVIAVKYEDLVQRPEEVSARLLRQLNLRHARIHEDTVRYPVSMSQVGGRNFHTDERLAAPPLKDSVGKWESQLSSWQRRRIETWIEDSELSRQYYSPIGASRARRIGRRILQRVRHYGAKVRRELANNASAVPERSR